MQQSEVERYLRNPVLQAFWDGTCGKVENVKIYSKHQVILPMTTLFRERPSKLENHLSFLKRIPKIIKAEYELLKE